MQLATDRSARRRRIAPSVALWAVFFCYATFSALLVQKLLLPFLPSLHAGNGLLTHDAIVFHSIAVALADSIQQHGWQSWTFNPAPGVTGNIAVLGALYALFGNDPSLLIPLNASAHALGGVLIYLLGRRLWPGEIGVVGGLLAAILFVVFPSSLTWYGQLHKDSYSIAGVLLVLYSWVSTLSSVPNRVPLRQIVLMHLLGMLLIGFVRPYFLTLVFVASLCMYLTLVASKNWRAVRVGAVGLLVLGAGAWVGSRVDSSDTAYARWEGVARHDSSPDTWQWHASPLPKKLDKYVENAARTRAGLIDFGVSQNAGSMIDIDVAPDTLLDVLVYAPRALQIALLAPFPSTWNQISLVRLVGIGETLIWYLMIPGVFLALYRRPSAALAITLVYCLFFLYVLGFINANVGTLYRYRYPFIAVFILIGALGWARIFRVSVAAINPLAASPGGSPPTGVQAGFTRRQLAKSGAIVVSLTMLGYLGFFLRDALTIRTFGLASDVDVFFSAIMLAMFLVSVFAFPVGDALAPALQDSAARQDTATAQRLISSTAFLSILFFFGLGGVLILGGSHVLPLVGRAFDAAKTHDALVMLAWLSPVLMLSGLSVLCNAILNAFGKSRTPAAAQLVVPVVAILALVVLGDSLGAGSVALGMACGCILNLGLLLFYLRKEGISIKPAWRGGLEGTLPEYAWLVLAALCASATVPLNYAFASSLSEGSVAAWAIGSKAVFFFGGLAGIATTSVVLPHFSRLVAGNQTENLRRELIFILMVGTFLSIAAATAISLLAEGLVRLAFEGGRFSAQDTDLVARVVRYGVVQLPFMTVGMLCVKFAVASSRSWQVLVAAILGVGCNWLLNLLLVGPMGVNGIALANALSMGVTASVMLASLLAMKSIRWVEAVMLAMSWLLFLTLMLCLHYGSYPGVTVSILALGILFATFFREWSDEGTAAA